MFTAHWGTASFNMRSQTVLGRLAWAALVIAVIGFSWVLFRPGPLFPDLHSTVLRPAEDQQHGTASLHTVPTARTNEQENPSPAPKPAAADEAAMVLVVDTADIPVPGATVEMYHYGQMIASGISDVGGLYGAESTSKGPLLYCARKGEYAGWATKERPISSDAGSTIITKIVLQRTVILTGRVVHGVDLEPLADIKVLAIDKAARPRPTTSWLAQDESHFLVRQARSLSDGSYQVDGLLSGQEYTVLAVGRGYLSDAETVSVSLQGASEPASIQLEALPVFGCGISLFEASSNRTFPSTFSQVARLRVETEGEVIVPWFVDTHVDPGGADTPVHFKIARRIAKRDTNSVPARVELSAIGHRPLETTVELHLLDQDLISVGIPLAPLGGDFQELLIYITAFDSSEAGNRDTGGQILIEGPGGNRTSQSIMPFSAMPITVALPRGRYEIKFHSLDGKVVLPGPTPEDFSVVVLSDSPAEVSWTWPAPLRTLALDVRDKEGRPYAGPLTVSYTRADNQNTGDNGEFRLRVGATVQSHRLSGPQYRLNNLEPGQYWFWAGMPGPQPVWFDVTGREGQRLQLSLL